MNTPLRARRFDARPLFGFVLFAAAAVFFAQMLDQWAFVTFNDQSAERRDWARLFRVAGYIPSWILVGVGMMLATRGREAFHRAVRAGIGAVLAGILSGLIAEAVKLIVRRERPGAEWGEYVFREFADRPWSTSGLGMPSSHAAVAFAACVALWRLYPRAWPVWLIIPIGCAYTRLLDRAHYLSDVTAAAMIGILAAWLIGGVTAPTPRPYTFGGAGPGGRG